VNFHDLPKDLVMDRTHARHLFDQISSWQAKFDFSFEQCEQDLLKYGSARV
jgi:hypothetical protein